MIPLSRKISLTLLLASVLIFSVRSQENLLDYKNSLEFARYLKSTRQYNFAMEEYERLNFLWPGDSLISLELVQTYRLNRQCNRLDDSFELLRDNIYRHHSLPSVKEYLAFSLSCRSESEKYHELSSMLKPADRSFYELSYFWLSRKYDSAFVYCRENKDLIMTNNPGLLSLTYNFANEKNKSPALAVMMSAVIPGSGKAYAKRWGDAVVSFLFVGSNAYASYRAFSKKGVKSVNGWIFGTLAFSFYSANLWGSAKAAKTYNSDMQQRYQDNAELIIYNSF
ncbi:MAG TPA: hypothetical protein ENH59_03580 [Bacteroidetes bacterium]|nr:hypothetical protein [Bacteroidota bacterium]